MKTTHKRLITAAVILLIAAIGITVWYLLPIKVLKNMDAADVKRIRVESECSPFSRVEITDPDDIKEIVESFQKVTIHRSGGFFSTYDGGAFSIAFFSGTGKELCSLRILDQMQTNSHMFEFDWSFDETPSCYGMILDLLEEREENDRKE